LVWPGGPPAGTVVLDVTARQREVLRTWVRHHHPGPLVVLLKPAERAPSPMPDRAQVVIGRPFRLGDLVSVLENPTVPDPAPPDPGPAPPEPAPLGAPQPGPPGAPEPHPPDSGAPAREGNQAAEVVPAAAPR